MLYSVGHMVKDHIAREETTDRIAHTTAFVTPVVEHWLEREIAQWVHPMKDRSDDPSHHNCECLYFLVFCYVWLRRPVSERVLSVAAQMRPPHQAKQRATVWPAAVHLLGQRRLESGRWPVSPGGRSTQRS